MSQVARVPEHAHPLVRFVYSEAIRQQISLNALSRRAGLTPCAVSQWGRTVTPQVVNLEAVLNALGFELSIRHKRDEEL